jgi:hypothetical protein
MNDIEKEILKIRQVKPNHVFVKNTRRITTNAHAHLYGEVVERRFPIFRLASISFAALAIFGGIFAFNQVQHSRLSPLDPKALRAEAEAIESQLKLAEVRYQEVAIIKKPANTVQMTAVAPKETGTIEKAQPEATAQMSIDEALEALSQ